ncbi:hypothetical protein [Streptomyces griseochromogenes]|uniref:hypothetical protein n=1 Tax=Streptomyces griseochromogenes TaxID=68214 RepID=UPI0037A7AE46
MTQLPQPFATTQAVELQNALLAGDTDRARSIEELFLPPAATSPERRKARLDHLRVVLLFCAHVHALDEGDTATAQLCESVMVATCSEKAIHAVAAGCLLHTGLETGTLHAEDHDQLAALLAWHDVSNTMKAVVTRIEKLP